MPTSGLSDRVAINFLPLNVQDFTYQIYRKELSQLEIAVAGTRFLPRQIPVTTEAARTRLEQARYVVSYVPLEGYQPASLSAWLNPGLTNEILYDSLHQTCSSARLANKTVQPDKQFIRKIGFILKEHDGGVREVIWTRPYALKTLGRFGFLIDFALRVPPNATISDKKRLELSLTHKSGRLNEDFYLDHYDKIEQFLHLYYGSIRSLTLHDGTEVEIDGRLPVIRSFGLSRRIFIFGGEKEGKSPFFGLQNFGPAHSAPSNARVVFMFRNGDRTKSQDLFRALRGDTYSTFPGMEKMFSVPFGKQNVSGIEITDLGRADVEKAAATLRAQYPGDQIIPVVLAPMSKHSTDEETRAYFSAKHAFLSQGLSSQFVDRKRLEDRAAMQWSISNIGLGLFAKLGGTPWRLKPSTEQCLIVGVGQAHRIINGRIERYFAYCVLADSSGIYESIQLLGDTNDSDEYHESLTRNLREVFLTHKNRYTSFVLHLTFTMKKREIEAIKKLLKEMKEGDAPDTEFVALKFNSQNDFFGFSVEHNSRIPYEGTVAPLSRKEFLLWFSGLRIPTAKNPTHHFNSLRSPRTASIHQNNPHPFFPITYKLPIFYPLCFEIHPCNGGVGVGVPDEIPKE